MFFCAATWLPVSPSIVAIAPTHQQWPSIVATACTSCTTTASAATDNHTADHCGKHS